MTNDRYDTGDRSRDERSRWRDERGDPRGRGNRDERGFLERIGDEISSWLGDDDAERRRRQDRLTDEREHGRERSYGAQDRTYGRDPNRDRSDDRSRMWSPDRDRGRDRDWNENRGVFARGGSSESDYNPSWRRELGGGGDRDWDRDRQRGSDRDRGGGYRPITGDYGRSSEGFFAAGGFSRGDDDRSRDERSQSPWGRDEYRTTSRAGTQDRSDRSRHEDPNYGSWRQRHMSELDRDYDDYRREHQSRFEDDFSNWRDRRQQKRGLLGQVREHMEVIGSDGEPVGTVDRIIVDRLILAKSDPESGGAHHSLSCSDVDRVEDNRVILDCTADEARHRWRDENRSRALFEREDQGEMGPRMLDRSFGGTYR
jgi:hypothetical protein